ncbi:uncharacterized protein LOC144112552 isoform X2 [Amblyomma americanum]
MPAPAHSPFARVTKRGGHRITFTQRRAGCTLAGCLCASLAALCLTLGAAAGVYYGVRFLEGQRTAERVYRGAFTVLEGDKFSESLSNSLADDFVRKADAYRAKLDRLFNSSAAFRGTEVIAFQRREDRELTVHFNVHFSPYGPVDAGELYLAMADELLRGRLGVFQGLKVDPESLSLQERRATASLPESWTPRRRYPGYLAGLSTSRPAVGRQAELLCEPLTLDHCRASLPYNSTAYPNAVGHATARDVYRDLVAYRQLADSECHPLAAELVCRLLQPQCDDAERRVVLPCREFCQEFWSSCQQQMPLAIAGHIDCGRLPEYSAAGSCHTKPGCANELKARGKESHICDGVVDCPDFSDETSCDNCGPGLLHCGDRQCVDIAQRCDARLDCDNGADEQNCLSLPELGGYLRAYQRGHFRKVCVDGLPEGRRRDSLLKQLADTACAALNLGPPSRVELHHDGNSSDSYLQLLDPPGLRFSSPGACRSDLVVYLLCSPPGVPNWAEADDSARGRTATLLEGCVVLSLILAGRSGGKRHNHGGRSQTAIKQYFFLGQYCATWWYSRRSWTSQPYLGVCVHTHTRTHARTRTHTHKPTVTETKVHRGTFFCSFYVQCQSIEEHYFD